MSTVKILSKPVSLVGDVEIADALRKASAKEGWLHFLCPIPNGSIVWLDSVCKYFYNTEKRKGEFLAFVLTDGKNTFHATAKVFRPRLKIQPYAKDGMLRSMGIVGEKATYSEIYAKLTNRIDGEMPKFRLIVLKDYHASGQEMMCSFVGIEPL